MLDTYLRPFYQRYLTDPFAPIIGKWFTPNEITMFSCFTGIAVLPALWFNFPNFAIALLLLSGYLDTLDGTIARQKKQITAVGAVLDILSDRIVEFAIIVGLCVIDPIHRGFLSVILLGSCFICVTSFLVVGIFIPNDSSKGFYYSPGLIERSEAFGFFICLIKAPEYFNSIALTFIGLVLLTSFIRIMNFIRFQGRTHATH